ncbi:hypothetical protein COY27_06275 [Candidatus Woesearchaeota archaeon CG_4_10_14_0_2_um_filter_33_13]|nr:MAG: hypothetical protein COY27_06275 [Candidatus Woesearchaeota archaeon CG_4_10_14_0_2_um_filter_33_13]
MNQKIINFKMAKKSKKMVTPKKSLVKKRVAVKSRTITTKEKEPEYMVQVNEPKNVRKNILESLREIIIFMQSYEKFRQIQEEKVTTFNTLKNDIKELTGLLENKLRRHFPKGKLSLSSPRREIPRLTVPIKETVEEPEEEIEVSRPEPIMTRKPVMSELDELESQLKDIEGQLRKIS